MKRLFLYPALSSLFLVLAVTAFADVNPYTRVLLPIYLEHPVNGAFGSVWTTQFSVHNGGTTESDIVWCSPTSDAVCLAFLPGDAALFPGETQHALPAFSPEPTGATPGRVLYLLPADDSNVAFNLRVADTSRSTQNAGTEIPVVREKDFLTSTARLLNIPNGLGFRFTLRLYSLNSSPADYAIRLYDENSNALVASFNQHIVPAPTGQLQFEPGYAEINGNSIAIGVGDPTPSPRGPITALRIEVEPLTQGSAFWAFVAVTNNDTQQLTVVTPQ